MKFRIPIVSRYYIWLIPMLFISVDFAFRKKVIVNFPDEAVRLYFVSILLNILFLKFADFILYKTFHSGKSVLYCLILFSASLYYSFTLIGTYGYYLANQIMPNYYTVEFIRSEPENAFIIFLDTFKWYHGFFIFFLSCLFAILFHSSASAEKRFLEFPWYLKIFHAVLIVVGILAINNNVRTYDQCFVADLNNFGTTFRFVYNKFSGQSDIGGSGILARNPIKINQKYPGQGFNILIILNESLRWQNMGLYGYNRATTPFLSKFATERKNEFFRFNRSWSNASTTVLSVPGILSGISPVEPSIRLHSIPLFWDYAKAQNYSTFFISSQKHEWFNFRLFFSSPAIDYYFSKEDSTLESFNDIGFNDNVSIELLKKEINSVIKTNRNFAGVLHLNTTHYPYRTEPEFQKWSGSEKDLYDNTNLKNDFLIGETISFLDSIGKLDSTIIISTSDHGEAFREHGYIGHIFCHYIETVSVPIWIFYPKGFQKQDYVESLIANENINIANHDILPTILDLMELNQNQEIRNISSKLIGKSLVKPLDSTRTILITNTNQIVIGNTGLSLVKGNYHYLFTINSFPASEEIYDYVSDPWETKNLWSFFSDEEKNKIRNEFNQYESTKALLDKYTIKTK